MSVKPVNLFFTVFFVLFFLFPGTSDAQRVGPIKVNAGNARQYRDTLISRTFGPTGFPYNFFPDSVNTNVRDVFVEGSFPYEGMEYPDGNLDSIDRLVVSIDSNTSNFPEKTYVYLLHPHNSNGKLFIYHSGHCTNSAICEDVLNNSFRSGPGVVIPKLLDSGYTVLAVPMFDYRNHQPDGYVCGFNNHNGLFSDSLYEYPLGLFFKPLIAALNQLGRNNYSDIYMMGLSGGGWMSSVYPAMDSSITMSFPVAGSWPMALRSVYYSDGDAEQYYRPIFRNLLDYHELYTLSCLAPSRKMLQINNRYDACCFNGAFQHLFYVDSVSRALEGTGGLFSYYLDETGYRHAVTENTMKVIFRFIRENGIHLNTLPEDTITRGQLYSYPVADNFPQVSGSTGMIYSPLKIPSWMYMDLSGGSLFGQAPAANILPFVDTVSFKVEDSLGRFVIYNYKLYNRKSAPFLFTKGTDSLTVYVLPIFSRSLGSINASSKDNFYFSNPSFEVTGISVMNNSVIRLSLNQHITAADSIGYNGYGSAYPILYSNGNRMDDFILTPVEMDKVSNNYAVPGMIRFNSETIKFEYFNGAEWIIMNR